MYIFSLFYHHCSHFLHTILFSKRKNILTILITRMKFHAIIPCQIEKIPTSNYFEQKNDNYFKKINICLKVNYIFKKFKKKILKECIICDKVIVQCFGFCEKLLATKQNGKGGTVALKEISSLRY